MRQELWKMRVITSRQVRFILILCGIFVFNSGGLNRIAQAAGEFVWVEMWRHEPSHFLTQAALGVPKGGKSPVMATLADKRVSVYVLLDEGPRLLTVIEGLPQNPAAIAVRPAEESDVVDLWVGTAAPGIVYVLRINLHSGEWEQRHRSGLVWDDIVEIVPFDLDGWGEHDVAVRTERNSLVVFRWTKSGYREERLGDVARDVRSIAVGRVTGRVGEDLVVTRGRDQILMFRWQPLAVPPQRRNDEITDQQSVESPIDGNLVQVWENYLWGGHAGLFVAPFTREQSDQIAVLTAQNLVYLYGWNQESRRVSASTSPLSWPEPFARLIGVGRMAQAGSAEFVQAESGSLAAWRIFPSVRKIRTLDTSLNPVRSVFFPSEATMVVVGERGFALLRPRPADYVRVLHRGEAFRLKHAAMTRDNTIYLSADDWRNLVGVTLRWNEQTGRVTGIRGFRFIVGDIRGGDWFIDGRLVELDARPVEHQGRLYMPVEFGKLLGARIQWEPYAFTLVVE